MQQHHPPHQNSYILHTTMPDLPKMKRRKPFQYKQNRVTKTPKTSRQEMSVAARAFVVGAIVASRDGYASARKLAELMPFSQQGISAVVSRIEERARENGANIWDSMLYDNKPGRGRPEILTEEQKALIVKIATASREARYKQSH
jgi:hypothetical protein